MKEGFVSRRETLTAFGAGVLGALALGRRAESQPPTPPSGSPPTQAPAGLATTPNRVEPPAWNFLGPLVSFPQKSPLIVLTDQPTQLETPRWFFTDAITPNHAFFVRWHLTHHPLSVDLSTWRLAVDGHVDKPLSLSMKDLLRLPASEVIAVNQCSGNSRSLMQPRVPGSQWGHGAMGCARWTGVRVRDLLHLARPKAGALQVLFSALDRGNGPIGKGSHRYLKSLPLDGDALQDALLAYSMNHEPLPLLHGFPLRLVVPGFFSTYWVKALEGLHILSTPDTNFWTAQAYKIPATPRASTTPDEVQKGRLTWQAIGRMPVRSFLIRPDGSSPLIEKMPVTLQGIAFSGHAAPTRVEISDDGGNTWSPAKLGDDHGPYAFRTWTMSWCPPKAGEYTLLVRATDAKGERQTEEATWNPGGYMWNRIESQRFTVGGAA